MVLGKQLRDAGYSEELGKPEEVGTGNPSIGIASSKIFSSIKHAHDVQQEPTFVNK